MKRSYRSTFNRLYEIASAQQGFFTTKQAKAAGYAENTHPYHVHAGNWIREQRGIYRLANFPQNEYSQLVMWSLWTRNRKEVMQGVYSHQTALSIYELSDQMPSKLHMTVPTNFRRRSAIPKVLVLHRADLEKSDLEEMQGFRVTRALRTIIDLIVASDLPKGVVSQALHEAIRRGLITQNELKRAKVTGDVRRILRELLHKVA